MSPPQSRVQTIQDDCCSQNGVNVCTAGGAPDRCDAACALAFIPYYTQCIEQVAVGSGGQSSAGGMRVFAELSEQCTAHLPAEETAILLSLVHEKDENSLCTIDTDSILTLSEAKAGPPPCESDTSGLCEVFISSGKALPLPCVSTAFVAKTLPLPCVSTAFVACFALCVSTAFVAKTLHLPCVSTAFVAKTLPLPCVSTAFAAVAALVLSILRHLHLRRQLLCAVQPGTQIYVGDHPRLPSAGLSIGLDRRCQQIG